ncbi:glycerol uptake facilitator-like aquaporin [Asticcacaulis solisilvae]|nr:MULTISPECIES: MIP/aquaporin family protein [Asticcacaulis]MBP2160318.1 glycerol uptake facilitator-like aquaporin [Asticcacaulis solisilvae]MDR6801379.1 glycerol uptake facilitator-like aquaporin [Asticcacaulis sp. BE141]
MYSLDRRLFAEFAGTLLLLATVVGSGIMAESLAGGNAAVALLGNTLATGAMLVVLITMLGPVSGAHFNPAVTLLIAAKRQLSVAEALAYMVVQVAGAVSGVWLAHVMFGEEIMQVSLKMRTGPGQWLSEGVATFGLILTIFATHRARPDFVPVAVGLYITAAYWFTASTSFANPAVTFARSLSDTFAGIRPVDAPAFMAAQIAGALLALVICTWFLKPAEA